MNLEQEVTQAYRVHIKEHLEQNRQGALALKADMERSPLYFKNRYTAKTLQIPKLYSESTIAHFRQIVETAYGIFIKVIQEYLNREDYRRLFPFSKESEQLILIPNHYESLLPMARFDIFYHEDTGNFYFGEINTDGTSAMNEDRLLGKLMIHNPAHQQVIRKYELAQFELFDSWVHTFLSLYNTFENKKAHPNVAIVDFLDNGTLREFQEFARRFQKAGVNCEVCDIRSLNYQDGVLISENGNRVDAIYRRAVTSDILSHQDELKPFLKAVTEGQVFLAGSFCTQIIHNKWLFHVLHLERTKAFLTEEENAFVEAHIPATLRFSPEQISLAEVKRNKDLYILKPEDSYASNGVFAGVEFGQAEWDEKAESVYDSTYICQRYCPQYASENIDFGWGDGRYHSYINMAGLYVYNGTFAGIYSRMAEGNGIIASHRNERTVPTYVIKGKVPY